MTKTPQLYTIALASILAGLLSGHALANDRDLQATTVPAAACDPYIRANEPGPRDLTWFWSYAGFELGGTPPDIPYITVALRCPLPINSIEISNPNSNDNDISKVRILYRDTDGFGAATQVNFALEKTTLLPSGELQRVVVCEFFSSANGTGATGYTRATIPCVHDIALGAFYHFEVHLYTQEPYVPGTFYAGFAGIDFPK